MLLLLLRLPWGEGPHPRGHDRPLHRLGMQVKAWEVGVRPLGGAAG